MLCDVCGVLRVVCTSRLRVALYCCFVVVDCCVVLIVLCVVGCCLLLFIVPCVVCLVRWFFVFVVCPLLASWFVGIWWGLFLVYSLSVLVSFWACVGFLCYVSCFGSVARCLLHVVVCCDLSGVVCCVVCGVVR